MLIPIIVLLVVVFSILGMILMIVSVNRKAKYERQYAAFLDQQMLRLEKCAADAADMIGDVYYESIHQVDDQFHVKFSTFIKRNNKYQEFTIFVGIDYVASRSDKELDHECVRAVRAEVTYVLGTAVNGNRSYRTS